MNSDDAITIDGAGFEAACGEAAARISGHVRRTPVEYSHYLSAASGAHVRLKLENYQLTGSFKLRGALNCLLTISEEQRSRGIVAASSGNHGMAVACGAARAGCTATVFVPESAAPSKLAVIREYGAEVRVHGQDCVESELAARSFADDRDAFYLSPYNDARVVAGQGTIGLELADQVGNVEAIFVALGGGGLISGTGGYLKAVGDTRVVACSPRNSPVMHRSLEAGRILDLPSLPTLSDGSAGGVEPGSITFDFCRRIVDESVLVEETQIRDAMRGILAHHHMLIEGAAGVAVAGFLASGRGWEGREIVIVLCGANVDPDVLRTVL
jgi:threonine dehydratase